jgi:uncharacterized protein (DUF433 family)
MSTMPLYNSGWAKWASLGGNVMGIMLRIEEEQRNGAPNVLDKPLFLGQYIVADPKVCHGKLTFRGTRIFVADVLEMVAEGTDWETIIYEWHGNITKEAISEAITLATKALLRHAQEYALEPTV